jgi:hypothetical protein
MCIDAPTSGHAPEQHGLNALLDQAFYASTGGASRRLQQEQELPPLEVVKQNSDASKGSLVSMKSACKAFKGRVPSAKY